MEVYKFSWMNEKAEFEIWNQQHNKECVIKKCVTKNVQ